MLKEDKVTPSNKIYQYQVLLQKLEDKAELHFTYDYNLYVLHTNNLNARIDYGLKNIAITDGDLKYLSHDEIVALLAHEVGHLKYKCQNHGFDKMYVYMTILPMVLSAFLAIVVPFYVWAMILIIIPTIGLMTFFRQLNNQNELFADTYGASLCNSNDFLKLFKDLHFYNKYKLQTDIIMTCKLWLYPKACFACLKILVKLLFKEKFNILHPSMRTRIKAIKSGKITEPKSLESK